MFVNQVLTADFFALSCMTGTLGSPTPLPTQSAPGTLSEPISFDPTKHIFPSSINLTSGNSTIAKRAECNENGIMYTEDLNIMATRFWGMTEASLSMPPSTYREYTQNSLKACLYNNYIFEGADIAPGEWAWGVLMVKNDCCFTDYCAGGVQQVHGTNGLSMNAVITPAGEKC